MISRGATVRHQLVKQKVEEDKFHVLAVWPFWPTQWSSVFQFFISVFFLKNDSTTSYNFTTVARPLTRMKRIRISQMSSACALLIALLATWGVLRNHQHRSSREALLQWKSEILLSLIWVWTKTIGPCMLITYISVWNARSVYFLYAFLSLRQVRGCSSFQLS